MGFMTREGEFFSGRVAQPDGDHEVIVVARGTRAAAIDLTLAEAKRRNWDWHIDLKRRIGDEDDSTETLASWSSLTGELPPTSRKAVTGLR